MMALYDLVSGFCMGAGGLFILKASELANNMPEASIYQPLAKIASVGLGLAAIATGIYVLNEGYKREEKTSELENKLK